MVENEFHLKNPNSAVFNKSSKKVKNILNFISFLFKSKFQYYHFFLKIYKTVLIKKCCIVLKNE